MGCGESKGQKEEGTVAPPPPKDGAMGKLLDTYTLGKVLGEGAFGIVYKCTHKQTKKEYAVKMIDKVETPLEAIKKESELLFRLAHANVVKLHGVFYEKAFVCLVMDMYKGGDLIEGMQAHWKTKGMIPAHSTKHLAAQVITSIHWLHTQNCVHRDVKGDNYLLDRRDICDKQCKVFLSDFGTVCDCKPTDRLTQGVGTKVYWSPEFYEGNYSQKVDIWAMGVIFFGFAMAKFPFHREQDTKTKDIHLPDRTPAKFQDFIRKHLTKKEKERVDGKEALEHEWLQDLKVVVEEVVKPDADFKPEMQETGANADVAARRQELISRLQHAAAKKEKSSVTELIELPVDTYLVSSFQIPNRRFDSKVSYQWLSESELRKLNVEFDLPKAVAATVGDSGTNFDSALLKEKLKQHGIDTAKFTGAASRTFEEFYQEIQSGAARLMLDASEHKRMVRVVDTVLLRITHGTGAATRIMVKKLERFPDGRVRDDIDQLPGTKREPHENTYQVADRLLTERLNLNSSIVQFDQDSIEYFEEEEMSPSYPGVVTVYRKEILTGKVVTADAPITSGNMYKSEDTKKVMRTYVWMTKQECEACKVKTHAPARGSEVSTLIDSPVGFSEEELLNFLTTGGVSGVDINKFGTGNFRSLQQFAQELQSGEASLRKGKDGQFSRVVDVVVLKLARQVGTETHYLLQASESKEGTTTTLNRFPAVKRREDENQFLAVQRLLQRHLLMSSNFVKMDNADVKITEEAKDSVSYPGIPTIYQKRIVSAKFSPPNVPNV